ncbi:MAG TPA: hypothetical protein DEA96_05650 [Leptospiraceae bacterium]|nr:hypothetical protein [Leptospiraceae bacterium]
MKLYIADSLEHLLQKLQSQLQKHSDPLRAPRILVPNRNLRRWMQMQLARRQGVAANLNFQYLEQGISSILAHSARKQAPASLQLWALIQALQQDTRAPGDSLEIYRRASHLTYLFRDYEYHRNPMIRAWQQELKTSPTALEPDIFQLESHLSLDAEDSHYREQKRLYQDSLGRLHEAGYLSFTELAGLALESEDFDSDPLYVFGMSRMSRLHLSILLRLSLHFPVRIFLFDVFAGALQIPQGSSWQSVPAPEFKTRLDEDALIVEHSQLSEQEYNFQRDGLELLYLFRLGQTFLQENNSDLEWHRFPGNKTPGVLQLLSKKSDVRIVEAPGMRKEIEFIHDDILLKLAADDSLKPEDIGILVPTMHRYRAHFEYVFGGRKQLPFNLTDFSARETSRLGDALRTILKFDQPLDRRNVFHLLSNPLIRQKWEIRSDDYEALLDKVDELNIFRGSEDSIFPVHSWKHGLRRLRLSEVMVGPGEFQGYLPAGPGIYDSELFARLWEFLKRLEQFRKDIQCSTDPFSVIRELIQTFISVEDRQEGRIYLALMEALASASEDCHRLDIQPDPLMAREWVLESLKEVAGGIGDYLVQGITVSALQPMRPIPFRYLYVAGLKEGDFPGFPVIHPEDLRRNFRLPGDSSLPDGNRFLFLEGLTSFEDGLILSYVGKDLARDDEFQPSSVILELEDFLAEGARESLPALWISDAYKNRPVLDPLHVSVLKERWHSEIRSGNPLDEPLQEVSLYRKSYRAHQLARIFTEPLRAFLEFKLNAYPLRKEDSADVSDEPYRLISRERKNLKYLLLGLAPHYLGQRSRYRELLEECYSNEMARGAAPADFFAELDRESIVRSQPFLALENPDLVALQDKGLYISSLRPTIQPLPFMQMTTPLSLRGMEFHFTIPFYSEASKTFLFSGTGRVDASGLTVAFLNLLFFALHRGLELNHQVHFISLAGEGKVESFHLRVPLAELQQMAEYICDELQFYGPLMFYEAFQQEEEMTDLHLEELLLDSWQELQDSSHPVLGMVMEKLDASQLMELILQSRNHPSDESALERRIQMRSRIEEVWQ